MLHIGIDGNEANVENRVGSNQYAYGILNGLYQANRRAENVSERFTIYLKSPPLPDMPVETAWWKYKVIGPKFAWTQWRLPVELYLSRDKPQVFYSPGHYAPRYSPIPTVVTIMDLAFLKMPNLFLKFKRGTQQLTEWTEYSVRQAKAVIAISEHTKQDIVEAYRVSPGDITVAYPGIRVVSGQRLQGSGGLKLPEKYILHLGTLQPRKNIVRLIQAFELLPPKFRNWHLVLAGQTGWLTEDIERAIRSSKVRDRIVRTGYVAPKDIPALISGAGCLMMVGLYEGFGIPPAEALAYGTLPVVSETTSLPEVTGEAGIMVDPYSVASIKRGIIVALEMEPEQKEKRLRMGKKHIQQFSWDASAQKILAVLIRVSGT